MNDKPDLNSWLLVLLSNKNKFYVQVCCYLMYHIWKACNISVFEGKDSDPIIVALEVVDAVHELNKHNLFKEKKKRMELEAEQERFKDNFHTVKVDAGIEEDDTVTFGCVILDDKANPILSLCRRDYFTCAPGQA